MLKICKIAWNRRSKNKSRTSILFLWDLLNSNQAGFMKDYEDFKKFWNLSQNHKELGNWFRFSSVLFVIKYGRKPKRFPKSLFGNQKGILAYSFEYQLSFSGNISFLENHYGFREYDSVFSIKKKVFHNTLRVSELVFTETIRFPRARKPKRYFKKLF
jgi:hypothetical protein